MHAKRARVRRYQHLDRHDRTQHLVLAGDGQVIEGLGQSRNLHSIHLLPRWRGRRSLSITLLQLLLLVLLFLLPFTIIIAADRKLQIFPRKTARFVEPNAASGQDCKLQLFLE